MKLKERLKQCYWILFKGKNLGKEYQELTQERKKLVEELKKQLEFMVSNPKPAMMANANSMNNAQTIPVYEVNIVTDDYVCNCAHGETLDVRQFDLKKVSDTYQSSCRPEEIEDMVRYLYERACHEFARVLIEKKLLRVEARRCADNPFLVTFYFEALYYGEK